MKQLEFDLELQLKLFGVDRLPLSARARKLLEASGVSVSRLAMLRDHPKEVRVPQGSGSPAQPAP